MKVTGGIFHDVPPSPTQVAKVIRTWIYKLSGLRCVSDHVIHITVTGVYLINSSQKRRKESNMEWSNSMACILFRNKWSS